MRQQNCTEVSAICPVEATTYGYSPNLAANSIFLVIFAIACITQIVVGIKTKVYSFSGAVAVGCLMEVIGYGGRLMMYQNPWNQGGFAMQITCIIIAPSFIAGSIYLTIKHTVLYNGPEFSRIKPSWYTWIFIGCDIGSILLQAAGGGIASTANPDLLDIGNSIIIAGIAFQVVTMTICGILAVDFGIKYFRSGNAKELRSPTQPKLDTKAQIFHYALAFAYVAVLIRCIYRLPEMAGGWGNELMRNEPEFLLLDGLMILLAAIALTAFHPGFFYPIMKTGHGRKSLGSQGSEYPLN